MNKEERGQLLRQRARAKGIQIRTLPREPRPPKYKPKGWINVEATYPLEGRSWEVRARFLKEADAAKSLDLKISRTAKKHPLNRIAEKWRPPPRS